MVAFSASPLVIRCGSAVYNFNESSCVGSMLDVLISKNLLVPVVASTNQQVLREQGKTLNVVEDCLGPGAGISEVKALLKDSGYAELASQISQLHCKRKEVAHPHVGIADRLKSALSKIVESQRGHGDAAGSPHSSTQYLVLDELIPCMSHDCMPPAWNGVCLNSGLQYDAENSTAVSGRSHGSFFDLAPEEFVFDLAADDIQSGNPYIASRMLVCETGINIGLPLETLCIDRDSAMCKDLGGGQDSRESAEHAAHSDMLCEGPAHADVEARAHTHSDSHSDTHSQVHSSVGVQACSGASICEELGGDLVIDRLNIVSEMSDIGIQTEHELITLEMVGAMVDMQNQKVFATHKQKTDELEVAYRDSISSLHEQYRTLLAEQHDKHNAQIDICESKLDVLLMEKQALRTRATETTRTVRFGGAESIEFTRSIVEESCNERATRIWNGTSASSTDNLGTFSSDGLDGYE